MEELTKDTTVEFTPIVLSHDKGRESAEIKSLNEILRIWNERIKDIEQVHKLTFSAADVESVFRNKFDSTKFFKNYFPDLPEYMREQMIQKVMSDITRLQANVRELSERYTIDSFTTFQDKKIILNDYYYEDVRNRYSITIRTPQMAEIYERAKKIEELSKEVMQFFGTKNFNDVFDTDVYTPYPRAIIENFKE